MRIIPRQRITLIKNALGLIISSSLKKSLINGKEIALFEKEFARYIGTKYAVAVPSARIGLHLIIKSLNMQGSDIILPSYTASIVPNVIIASKANPAFVDIDDTYNINPKKIREKITKKTRAIIATHMEGQPCNIKQILKMAREHGLKVIEDCAHALGAEYNGKKVGSFGDVAYFSFGKGKHINTLGGGMVVTNNAPLAKGIRNEISKFRNPKKVVLMKKIILSNMVALLTKPVVFGLILYPFIYLTSLSGKDFIVSIFEDKRALMKEIPEKYKVKYSDIQAIIGLQQLKTLDENNEKRRENTSFFTSCLKNKVKTQKLLPEAKPAYLEYTIQVKDREKLRKKLLRHGIDTQRTWMDSCSSLEMFKKFRSNCPVADKLAKEALYLPSYPTLNKKDAFYIANILKNEV